MKVPLKVALPTVMGLLCALLMLWDLHNQRVIRSMGMAWDTGAPLWPYQTPDTLLFALNTPAFFISNAREFYFRVGAISPLSYSMFFPAILVWWWLVGLYLDRRLLRESVQRAPIWALLLCLLAIGLIALGVEESRWAFRWWWTYSRAVFSVSDLILLRLLAPSIWCVVLGFVALLAARRRAQIWRSPTT
jgi:hypothetical protein